MKFLLFTLAGLMAATPACAGYYAELDKNALVLRVIVVDDNGGDELTGVAFCQKLYGGGTWVQTDIAGGKRKNYAAQGYSYDSGLDAFVPPQPWSSWGLNPATANWEPPVPRPDDGRFYTWDESTKSWILVKEQ